MTLASEWDALIVHPNDDVATALRPLKGGSIARIQVGADASACPVVEDIPFGHKIALRDLSIGEPVRKYGEVIGETVAPIQHGAWVHIHNLVSRRARQAFGEA